MAIDKTKFVRGNNLAATDFNFDDAGNFISVKTDATSAVGIALAALTPTVADASATEAGIVNLTDGQVLGQGRKVIDGITVTSASANGAGALTRVIQIGSDPGIVFPGEDSLVIGFSSSVTTGGHGVVVGHSSSPTLNGVSVGNNITSSGQDGTVVGSGAETNGNSNVVIGTNAKVIGSGSSVSNGTAVGAEAKVLHSGSVALGVSAETTKADQVVLGNDQVETVETYGYVGAKGHVTDVVLGPSAIDLSQGEYFVVSGSVLATAPINPPTYAFETGGSATFFIVEVNDASTFTAWWPGIRWENGTPPTLTAAGTGADLFGFICAKPPVAGFPVASAAYTGIVLAKALG